MAIKLIILDRDGVINKELSYVGTPEQFEFIEGVVESVAHFKKAGYWVAVATNQSHIARGRMTHDDLAQIHDKMLTEIRRCGGDIDRIVYCPSYDNNDPRRKPNPGMLLELLDYFNVSGNEAVFIGDYARDMQAGERAGCHLIMVESCSGQEYAKLPPALKAKTTYIPRLSDAPAVIETWKQGDSTSSSFVKENNE